MIMDAKRPRRCFVAGPPVGPSVELVVLDPGNERVPLALREGEDRAGPAILRVPNRPPAVSELRGLDAVGLSVAPAALAPHQFLTTHCSSSLATLAMRSRDDASSSDEVQMSCHAHS